MSAFPDPLPSSLPPIDRQVQFLNEEFETFYTERLVAVIRAGQTALNPAEKVRLEALQTFVLTKLAALQVATGTAPTP